MVYYSELLNKPILGSDRKRIGSVKDMCFIDRSRYGIIAGIILDVEGSRMMIPWKFVAEIGDKADDPFPVGIYLNVASDEINYYSICGNKLSDILDKQLIDINGARVVRVNDVLLGRVANKFIIVGVDTSTKGIMRRLGVGFLSKKGKEHIILWKDVAPLSDNVKNLQLKVKVDRINQLHAAEIADLIRDLSLEEKEMVFNSLSKEKAAETLLTAQPEVQKTVIKTLSYKNMAKMLETLSFDDAASILNMMPVVTNNKVIKLMKPGIAAKIKKFMSYEKQTAGSMMSTTFITIAHNATAQSAIEEVRHSGPSPKYIIYLYILDDNGELKGVISLRDLLLAKPDQIVSELIRRDLVTVYPHASIDDVYNLMSKYKLWALPVIDKNKKIQGVIRSIDVLDELVPSKIKKQRIAKHKKLSKVKTNNGIQP